MSNHRKGCSIYPAGWVLVIVFIVALAALLFCSGCASTVTIVTPGIEDTCVHEVGHDCYDGRTCVSSDEERAAYQKCLEDHKISNN